MTAANPQKVLSLLNERLTPHGVKCRDMTLVVANDPSAIQKVCQNLEAHLDRAAIIFNASGHLDFMLTLLGGGPGAQWIFMHNDNYYCPRARASRWTNRSTTLSKRSLAPTRRAPSASCSSISTRATSQRPAAATAFTTSACARS